MQYSIFALSDSSIIIQFTPVIDVLINKNVLAICKAIQESFIQEIYDVVPAYNSITVHYDLVALKRKQDDWSFFQIVKEQLENILSLPPKDLNYVGRQMRIPVCYDEKYALDIKEVSTYSGLSYNEIINIHLAKKYRVYMVGFLPGFAYMGEVDTRIAVPRKQEPRMQIPAGSVGIAGNQTGIYPLTSPGGWQIIGKTPMVIFNKTNEVPVLFEPGDDVQFFSITADEFDNY